MDMQPARPVNLPRRRRGSLVVREYASEPVLEGKVTSTRSGVRRMHPRLEAGTGSASRC